MYKAPDFVKVNVNVKESFAAYNTSCPNDEYTAFTTPCKPGDQFYTYRNFLEEYPTSPWQCYSVQSA